jgi:hypothetical protein
MIVGDIREVAVREDGLYWVFDRRSEEWRIAKWNSVMHWWVIAFVDMDDPAYPGGVTGDLRWARIGPKVEPPAECLDEATRRGERAGAK